MWSIESMSPSSQKENELNKLLTEREDFRINGYRIKLSPDELKEQEKDSEADERLSKRLLQESERWMSVSRKLEPLVLQQKDLLNSCKSLGIKDYHGPTTISSMNIYPKSKLPRST